MLNTQYEIKLSPYRRLYDIIVPSGNLFRRMADEIDFSFIFDELKAKYNPNTGRKAISPIQLLKYLIIKAYTDLSDRDLVEAVRVNMAFKYFLGLNPEDEPVDSSTLTVFRRQRLKDTDLLDVMIKKDSRNSIGKANNQKEDRYNRRLHPHEVAVSAVPAVRPAKNQKQETALGNLFGKRRLSGGNRKGQGNQRPF